MPIPFLVFGKRVTKVMPRRNRSEVVKSAPVYVAPVRPKALPIIQIIPINKPTMVEIKKVELAEIPVIKIVPKVEEVKPIEIKEEVISVEKSVFEGKKGRKKKDDSPKDL
jgi:hypothetical protein